MPVYLCWLHGRGAHVRVCVIAGESPLPEWAKVLRPWGLGDGRMDAWSRGEGAALTPVRPSLSEGLASRIQQLTPAPCALEAAGEAQVFGFLSPRGRPSLSFWHLLSARPNPTPVVSIWESQIPEWKISVDLANK